MLRETSVLHPRLGLRDSWTRVLAASYFVQLLEQVAEPRTPIPELFDLLTRALDYLESHDPDRRAVLHFERELARAQGLQSPTGGTAIEALQQGLHVSASQREALLKAVSPVFPAATSDPERG